MTFTRVQSETLRLSTWVPLVAQVDDNSSTEETFLVKSIFTEDSYLVLFTNLRYVWFEELFAGEITNRFQESNQTLFRCLIAIVPRS